ncbi:MAG: hypothetical protein KAT27_05785, partial [Desulfobacterales bacterium]|nr:hypothetical protein [Desulfobacterales bacterium]
MVSDQWSVGRRRQDVSVPDCLGKISYNFRYFYVFAASRPKHFESREFLCKGHPVLVHNTDHVKTERPCQSVDAWGWWAGGISAKL